MEILVIKRYLHGSSPPLPPNFRGYLKISDQNNWRGGGPEQKFKFGGELN